MSEQQPPAAAQPQGAYPQNPYPQNPYPQDFDPQPGSAYPGPYGQTPPAQPWGQHPAPSPAAPAKKSRVGVVIASIVGGMLLLGATFASGAALGWWLGSHHAGSSQIMVGPQGPNGELPPGWQNGRGDDRQGDSPNS